VEYSRHTLDNGLRVLLHRDTTTPLVTVNVLYLVGSRDERPDRTGFAHLFEHLMFGGTPRYPDFDAVVDSIAGESNAFTTCDYTNYYMTFPADGLPTALALEADRMAGVRPDISGIRVGRFSEEVLEVQKRVVTEEYHQRYMNQPYGDVYLLLRPLCYKVHPYRWPTIGADIRHVQEATMEEVQDFFDRYYRPDNAILCVAGNIDEQETLRMVEEAFGMAGVRPDINGMRRYPEEPEQREARLLEVGRDVPNDAFYMAWVMSDRYTPDPVSGRPLYYAFDALSDVLATGHSSRLYRRMVQEEALLTEVNAFITGDMGPGLFVVTGKLRAGVDFATAEAAVREELDRLAAEPLPDREVEKVANHYENTFVYSQYKASDRAYSLCYYEMMGDVALANSEPEHYRALRPDDLQRVAAMLTPERCCTLRIRKLKIE
jgi:predicted Zn-dependent peptidase